jgi:hypothetical protein
MHTNQLLKIPKLQQPMNNPPPSLQYAIASGFEDLYPPGYRPLLTAVHIGDAPLVIDGKIYPRAGCNSCGGMKKKTRF